MLLFLVHLEAILGDIKDQANCGITHLLLNFLNFLNA